LTARLALGPQPLRIAVDRQLRIPRDYHLYDNSTPTWIINEQLEAEQEQVLFLQLPFGEALIPALLDALYQAGKTSLIVEGGTSLQQQFIQLGLWDEARIFTTSVSMDDGIAAPALHDAHPVYATQLDGDTLSVLLHKDNPYHYMPGASL
jgi:diaminohydroxyphosphoribosylaminopyrimidine deaminase/5-amino-6-(5-phosphoribosylamino)uracil reductase